MVTVNVILTFKNRASYI